MEANLWTLGFGDWQCCKCHNKREGIHREKMWTMRPIRLINGFNGINNNKILMEVLMMLQVEVELQDHSRVDDR